MEPLDIRLKLLSENNVILAKCLGMETEVFMPVIIEGRINIINVIPQRRCRCISTTHLVAKRKRLFQPSSTPSDTLNNWHASLSSTLSAQKKNVKHNTEPLANSTPTQAKANFRNIRDNTFSMTFPSPEPVRRAVVEANNTTFIAPFTRSVGKSTKFNNVEKNVPAYVMQPFNETSCNVSTANNEAPSGNLSDMTWPQTPPMVRQKNNADNTLGTILVPSPEGQQWRKVVTPVRTYARQKHAPNRTFRPLIDEVPQHHLENPTQPPVSKNTIERKVHKMFLDTKIFISPRSFKQQLKSESLAIQQEEHRKELRSLHATLGRKPAFNLLTNLSNRSSCIAKALNDQFRNRCVNKASSTYPKYKKLCAITPLEVKSSVSSRELNQLVKEKTRNVSEFNITSLSASNDTGSTHVYKLKTTRAAVQRTLSYINTAASSPPALYKIAFSDVPSKTYKDASQVNVVPFLK